MVLLSFSYPGFDEKIPNGKKTYTTRKFTPKRFAQFANNKTLHLYWKSRTKQKKFFGLAQRTELFFTHVQFFDAEYYDLEKIEEDRISVGLIEGAYAIRFAEFDPYLHSDLDDLSWRDLNWKIKTFFEVENYVFRSSVGRPIRLGGWYLHH